MWDTATDDPPDPITDDWCSKDRKATANSGFPLEDCFVVTPGKKRNCSQRYVVKFERYHEKSTLSNKVTLLRRICSLKLTEGGNTKNHLIRMQDLIDRLETLAEQLTVALFLSSLPASYGALTTALETRPEEDLMIELVKNKLFDEYSIRKSNQTDTYSREQKALKTIKGHSKSTAAANPTAHEPITCYFRKKPNHVKKECNVFFAP